MILSVACATFMLAACGGSSNKSNSSNTSTESATSTEAPNSSASSSSDASASSADQNAENTIALTGNDKMQYDKTEFTVKAGEEITLSLKNIGKLPANAMSHDVVVLPPGTDVKKFGAEATKAGDLEKMPSELTDKIIAKTKLLGPGESDTITFTLKEPGKYVFLCSFPGHYVTMNGTITAE